MKIRRIIRDRTYNEFLMDPINRRLMDNITVLENKIFDLSRLVNLQAYMEGFTFYTSSRYRGIPIDVIPRVISSDFYSRISDYLVKRNLVLNHLVKEIYQEKSVHIPDWIVKTTPFFKPEMMDFSPPKGIYIYVNGADIVRVNGEPYILEDNVRVPSGIAYSYRAFEYVHRFLPELSQGYSVEEPSGLEYLYDTLRYASGSKDPVIVLLTDGPLNSAYFEHRFISDKLGFVLAEPKDIQVNQGEVVVKTLDEGEVHVDIIYRRIEDLELLTPDLMRAYLRGWVTIANAPGVGVADDKATFVWIPFLAERYGISLKEVTQPFTICLYERENLQIVINNPSSYVIKKREGYGGIGLSIMKDENASVLKELVKEYENFIAQEVLDFDTVVSAINDSFYETFADFRFFTYYDRVATAVLSRVGVVGSRVTNNSSGGMVKPVWITR